MKTNIMKKNIMMLIGILLIGISVGMFRTADFGTDPFTCMNLGISGFLNMKFGILQFIVNIIIFLIVLLYARQYIGVGTLINMVFVGFLSDYVSEFLKIYVYDNSQMAIRIILLFVGVIITSFGVALYMTSDLGIAPYDALAFIIEKITKGKVKFKWARVLSDFVCVVVGVSFGARLGIGTAITVFCTGLLVDFFRNKIIDPFMKNKKEAPKSKDDNKEFCKRSMTIKSKLVLTFFTIGILPVLIVGSVSYIVSQKTIEAKSSTFSMELLEQINLNINHKLNQYEEKVTAIISDANFNDMMLELKKKPDGYDGAVKKKEIENRLTANIASDWNISSFCIMTNENTFIGSIDDQLKKYLKNDFVKSKEYEEIKESNGEIFWISGTDLNSEIFLIKRYIDMSKTNDYGFFIMSIKLSAFDDLLKNKEDDNNNLVVVISENNKVIYSTKPNDENILNIINKLNDNEKSNCFVKDGNLISYSECNSKWKATLIIPMNYLIGDIKKSGYLTLGIGLLCAALAIVIGIYVSLGITKPIYKIIHVMDEAKDGNLKSKFIYRKKDEIGNLGHNFNLMIDKIRMLISQVIEVSNISLNNSKLVSEFSTNSAESFNEITCAVKEISKGAMNQASEVINSKDIIENLSEKIEEIRENTDSIKKYSNQARMNGKNSIDNVQQLVDTTNSSLQSFFKIRDEVSSLREDSKKIENIVKVVSKVSEETNLLALNASIEAARAGESGKGFSVVAQHIKNLSDESQKSINDIKKIINEIQGKIENTSVMVEQGKVIFNEQDKSVINVSESIKEIIDFTENMGIALENIYNTVEYVATDKENMLNSIRNIAFESENSASMTEEVLASVEEQNVLTQKIAELSIELLGYLEKLDSSINIFRI